MNNLNLIGNRAFPKDDTYYAGHWGYIKSSEGDGNYILSGGSLGDCEPLLHRSEFVVRRAPKNNSSSGKKTIDF